MEQAEKGAQNGDGSATAADVKASTLQAQFPRRRSSSSMSDLGVDMDDWTPARLKVYSILHSKMYDNIMASIIVFNVVLMLVEANLRANCYPDICDHVVIIQINRLLLIIYTFETGAHAFCDRGMYFRSSWNVLDFFIVATGWIDELIGLVITGDGLQAMKVLPILRMLRVARLMRAIKWIKFHPELYIMIRGFFGAIKAMFWGFVLILVLLMFWSLVSVEVIHPINYEMLAQKDPSEVNEFCRDAFSSLFLASLLYFQTLVAGDSWGACMIDIIKYEPWTFFLFAVALVSVSLGFMNLILAVIVDNACAAREGDREEQLKHKKDEEAATLKKWKEVIQQVDEDENGTITKDELLSAYEIPDVKHTLNLMGVDKEDLTSIFTLLDVDGSGDLDYDEFINAFLKAQGQDLRIYLMMSKIQVDAVAKAVQRLSDRMDDPNFGQPTGMLAWSAKEAESIACLDSAEQVLASAQADSFDEDFARINGRLQDQFAALERSILLNTATLSRHTEVLHTAFTDPSKFAMLNSSGVNANAGMPIPARAGLQSQPHGGGDPKQAEEDDVDNMTHIAV